jgi:poly-beta-1,6 N-acetyl-D-glucosamine export porin PgaA
LCLALLLQATWGFAQTSDSIDALIAQGRTAAHNGQRYEALRAFGEAARRDPNNTDAQRGLADMLAELGAPFGAAKALTMEKGSADIGLRSRQATSLVRWGQQVRPLDPRQRFATTDQAINALENLLTEARALPLPDPGLERRLQRDLAIALRDRQRWADVLTITAALRDQGDKLPAYVRHAEADALLALRRPHEARAAYAEVLATDPDNREALDGRFYAEVEDEDLRAAIATADAALAAQAPLRRFGSAGTVESNPDWLDAQVRAAQVRGYADLPDEAWERMLPLAEGAPALGYLRAALGGLAAQSGWPRRSAQEISIAHSLAPDDMGTSLALVESDIRRREWERAANRLATFSADHPADAAVQRTQREMRIAVAPELRIDISTHNEDGGGSNAPGAGNDAEVRFYSPPLQERLRLAGATTHSSASLPEGNFTRDRLGAGLEGRWPDVTAEAFAWNNRSVLSGSGASLLLRWEPNDFWSLEGQTEHLAAETPMRALVYGITANSTALSANYNWSESRSASLAVHALAFSDGNQRMETSASLSQRVYARPGLRVTVQGSVYGSTNSQTGGPYFSPGSDTSVSGAATVDHLLWRSYEHSLRQRLTVGIGAYQQSAYGSDTTGSVRYEQEYQASPFSAVRYGMDWARRIYDGVPERSLTLFVALEHRFR